MLNPLWLKTFTTLIDTGHFTQTAEKLYMTQPGVSQHIKKLEAACGYELIKRDKKTFTITEQGSAVYHYATTLEKNEQQLIHSLGQDDPYVGSIHLSCSGSLALLLYPKLLDLQVLHPTLVPHVEAAPQHKILKDILEGHTDLGLVTQLPDDPRFDSEKIGQEPLCLMLPKSDLPKENKLTADYLKRLGIINHPDARHYFSLFFAQCDDATLSKMSVEEVPISGYVNQLAQILLPVSKGLGFTVLPKSTLDSFVDRDKIAVYSLPQEISESVYLLSKKHRNWPARFITLRDEIKASMLP